MVTSTAAAVVRELGPDTYHREVGGPADGRRTVRFRGEELSSAKVPGRAGERGVGSAEMLERIRPVLRPAGITRLADITGLDCLGVPVTLAIRPNGRTLSNSAGKGLSLDDALVSGAMEALELFHAEEWACPTERCTYEQAFRRLNAPAPDRLPLTGWGLFREQWTYSWVTGWDLVGQTEVGIPEAMVRMGDQRGRLASLHAFQVTSNGLASGGNLLEAVHSGLLEVIERDAVTCWQQRRDERGEPPPNVSPAAFGSDLVDELVDRLAQQGAKLVLLDCTLDTLTPVYTAFLFASEGEGRGVYKGFGAHLDPVSAVLRAITEACQARAVHIAGSRDDLFRHRIVAPEDDGAQIRVLDRMHRMAAESPDRAVPDSASCATFEEDVALMIDRLGSAGLDQIVVVDLSKPYMPMSVVKVVVPGLEGYLVEDYRPGYRALGFAEREEL